MDAATRRQLPARAHNTVINPLKIEVRFSIELDPADYRSAYLINEHEAPFTQAEIRQSIKAVAVDAVTYRLEHEGIEYQTYGVD